MDTPSPTSETVQCRGSSEFAQWLHQTGGSIAVTTYQAGKVVLVGCDGRRLHVLARHFARPMGLAVHGSRLALATREELLFLADAPLLARSYRAEQQYDALYLPRGGCFTGELNLHDMAFAGDDELWAVNTRFSCLATFDLTHSFVPRWQPRFVSRLAPEDRCHLNGLAMRDGRPKYVTAMAESDEAGRWREHRRGGGVLVDVDTSDVLARGFSMPHSPRWHAGRLWLLNSGAGELCVVDPLRGTWDAVCALPGYVRGLCFVGNSAVVGLSRVRATHLFDGLPVQERFGDLQCGVAVIDLASGRSTALFEFTAGAEELYDVQFLPGVKRPTILNRDRAADLHAFTTPDFAYRTTPPDRPETRLHRPVRPADYGQALCAAST